MLLKQCNDLKKLVPKKFYKSLFFLILGGVLGNILEIFGISAFYLFLVSVGKNNSNLLNDIKETQFLSSLNIDDDFFKALIFLILVIFIIRILIQLFIVRFSINLEKRMYFYFSYTLFKGYIETSYLNLLNKNSQKIILNVWAHVSEVVKKGIIGFTDIVLSSMMILFLVTTLLIIELEVTLIIFFIFIVAGFIYFKLINKNLFNWNKQIINLNQNVIKIIKEMVEGLKIIKVLDVKEYFNKNFKIVAKSNVDLKSRIDLLNNIPRLFFELILILIIFSFILFNLYLGKDFNELIASLGLIVMTGARLTPNINKLTVSLQQFKNSYPSLLNITSDYSIFTKKNEEEKLDNKVFFKKNIKLENVNFKFNKSHSSIRDINITINKGSIVGFVGESGSGKTTTINILLGLIKIDTGKYLIDNIDVTNLPIFKSGLFSFVPQNTFILDDTVRSNIVLTTSNIKSYDKKIWDILDDVSLKDLVENLPGKLDYVLGETGKALSGGECQRISIARALLKDHKIIVLDEPTSALDFKNKIQLIKIINKLKDQGITIVIISHDLDISKNCDVVYSFENGQIKNIKNRRI